MAPFGLIKRQGNEESGTREVGRSKNLLPWIRAMAEDARSHGQWQDASLELLVHDAFRQGESHFDALRGSDKKTADKLFAALREARDAMRRGATPAGAVSYDRDPEVEYRFPDDEP